MANENQTDADTEGLDVEALETRHRDAERRQRLQLLDTIRVAVEKLRREVMS
jgi:hypothetical protein